MPELPEIYNLAVQMNKELSGKTIGDVVVRQEKCLNMTTGEFKAIIEGKKISTVTSKGKWVFVKLEPDAYFLLNLGMGGEALYHKKGESLQDKYRLAFTFDDGSRLSIGFWWFGYAHAVTSEGLASHKMTSKLGISPLDDKAFTFKRFSDMLQGKKGNIKSFLMSQENVAGIGNVYIQDILFKARIHPDRKVPTITDSEKKALYEAIKVNLREAVALGGLAFEKDLYGNPGRITGDNFQAGYKGDKPCPVCGTYIVKIKTGSTASYVCPKCQR
jgi:formamidopyrimidine-DNA glycosylase